MAPPAKPPAVEETPPAPSNVPDPLPPSSESPSMGWLAMANDQSPLADAVKGDRVDAAFTVEPFLSLGGRVAVDREPSDGWTLVSDPPAPCVIKTVWLRPSASASSFSSRCCSS